MFCVFLFTVGLLSDTIPDLSRQLDEVVVVSERQGGRHFAKGQVASIDEHLSELKHVSLVRRGSYAWEPMVNNMKTERVSTTIDGMKIFYACTDKMDPVTSYVESGNLQSISLNAGINGNPQATGNIGGALDLKLRKTGFNSDPFHLNTQVGYEANGNLQIYGADAAASSNRFYTNGGLFYRSAGNYRTGGGQELQFSQFHKVNAFVNAGYKLAEYDILEGTLIADRATDVGYPALNMDVKLAEALITSLSYRHSWTEGLLNSWETKIYYNQITHIMDDTKRPDVAIHMDMPGESTTAGLYSLITAYTGMHTLQMNVDGYYNRLFADMTMYPGGAAPMYMVTWPDVHTVNSGLAVTDDIGFDGGQNLHLSAKVAWQQQTLNNEEGCHALSVFFPGMKNRYYQTTGRIAASYQFSIFNSQLSVGTGWGCRAPTVTEAYGYYLNNTLDQYDYIGNPRLSNESAVELNANWQLSIANFRFSADGNAFLFHDYIIGQFEPRLSAMTVGSEGVKVYGNISRAMVANASATARWQPFESLAWEATLNYALGRDADGDALPLIAPFGYSSRLIWSLRKIQMQAELKGDSRQTVYGGKYGETSAPAWNILNLTAEYRISDLTLRAGVENLFDRLYSTYADWNGIPQKGRNIYLNLSFEL